VKSDSGAKANIVAKMQPPQTIGVPQLAQETRFPRDTFYDWRRRAPCWVPGKRGTGKLEQGGEMRGSAGDRQSEQGGKSQRPSLFPTVFWGSGTGLGDLKWCTGRVTASLRSLCHRLKRIGGGVRGAAELERVISSDIILTLTRRKGCTEIRHLSRVVAFHVLGQFLHARLCCGTTRLLYLIGITGISDGRKNANDCDGNQKLNERKTRRSRFFRCHVTVSRVIACARFY
jgi:hypothetical protein